jgi:hypothetical protein
MSETLNIKLVLDSSQLGPSDLQKSTLSLEKELEEAVGGRKTFERQVNKDIDPLAFAALSISMAPIAMTKFFEFLNMWALRRENRNIKIKIQLGKNKSIEFEGSETLSKKDVETWILVIEKALKNK